MGWGNELRITDPNTPGDLDPLASPSPAIGMHESFVVPPWSHHPAGWPGCLRGLPVGKPCLTVNRNLKLGTLSSQDAAIPQMQCLAQPWPLCPDAPGLPEVVARGDAAPLRNTVEPGEGVFGDALLPGLVQVAHPADLNAQNPALQKGARCEPSSPR